MAAAEAAWNDLLEVRAWMAGVIKVITAGSIGEAERMMKMLGACAGGLGLHCPSHSRTYNGGVQAPWNFDMKYIVERSGESFIW